MNKNIGVIIADDHPLIRDGMRQLLRSVSGFVLQGEAHDGTSALTMIRELQPDIAVLDVDMPGMNGLEVARTVQKENLPTDIIVLTMYREEDMFNSAMDLGVRGYVLKDNAVTDIVACINAVAEGTYYLSPRISEYLVGRSERARALLKKRPELDTLTPTEKRVLSLIAEEKTSKEIAEEMHVALKTVENHRSNISGKLNLRGSHSLLKFAIGHKSFLN